MGSAASVFATSQSNPRGSGRLYRLGCYRRAAGWQRRVRPSSSRPPSTTCSWSATWSSLGLFPRTGVVGSPGDWRAGLRRSTEVDGPGIAANGGCLGLQTLRFQPLDGTLEEVKELASAWRHSGSSEAPQYRCCLGPTRVRQRSRNRRLGIESCTSQRMASFLTEVARQAAHQAPAEWAASRRRGRQRILSFSPGSLSRGQPPRVRRPQRRRRHPHGRRSGFAGSEQRRMGGAVRLRHRRWRDPRRRRRVRAAPRVSSGRRAHGRDELVVGGRSGDPRVDEGALRGAVPAQLSTADAVHEASLSVLRDRRARASARIRSTGRRSSPPATGARAPAAVRRKRAGPAPAGPALSAAPRSAARIDEGVPVPFAFGIPRFDRGHRAARRFGDRDETPGREPAGRSAGRVQPM